VDEIEELLELHTLEEVFEVLDITPYEVVSILLKQGYVELPDYVRRPEYTETE
jgi:hypothetical protein